MVMAFSFSRHSLEPERREYKSDDKYMQFRPRHGDAGVAGASVDRQNSMNKS
jgi:hypothetical protein